MKLIDKTTGEVIEEIATNHSMCLDEVIDLIGTRRDTEGADIADIEIDGTYYYYDDLDIEG